ncbi:class I SAM-dependent methyltransferase [Streptomyces xiamenensis]|uniref:class I SAM-dependent methyltransferase n=1 Tax=Streptomyces xiamenensis TaxID=408015 RepID=UPI003D74D22D
MRLAGQEEYGALAEVLVRGYEGIRFEEVHREALPFLPSAGARVLDIGAGSGRDAAALVARGFRVVAVEPADGLRELARHLHPEPGIEWIEGALPDIAGVQGQFSFVLLSAVWMHLDEGQRETAMVRLSELVTPGGSLVMTLRHGPVSPGRGMFDVPAQETVELAHARGLAVVHRSHHGDRMGRTGISWDALVFRAVG